ncbi:MerR family transcriptional regulator [bacterium]|nr:MerR family transcriptional regulator [candidate division CSSED10-310 bacterium]
MIHEKCLKIGEVSTMLNIPAYVLRYWETEFRELQPRKTRSGQRLYSEKDLDFLRLLVHLRYEEKLTISGCRARLKAAKSASSRDTWTPSNTDTFQETLLEIKKSLQDVLEDLR